jgi:uncharacterized protein
VTTYLSPGVYIEEVPAGPQPIAAAPTSVLAIVGQATRGPLLTPTRVTGWAEYRRAFGDTSPGFMAESVYGFFENGGPAAYVVRVDPSVATRWTIRDGAGADVFAVDATSPGSWANGLELTVTPDTSGGNGQAFHTTVTADAALPAGTAVDLAVESVQGVAAGDSIILVGTGGTVSGEVNDVGPGTIRVTRAGGGGSASQIRAGDTIATRFDAAALTVRLAAANGFKAGDLLLARLPDGTRASAMIEAAAQAGAGMVLTLSSGLGSVVPGAQFASRTTRVRGQIPLLDSTIRLSDVAFGVPTELTPLAPDMADGFEAVATNGVVGRWESGTAADHFRFGPNTPPPGQIEVQTRTPLLLYEERLTLTDPALGDLTERFSFLPGGSTIVLSRTGATAALTRSGDALTTSDSLTGTWTLARFRLPTDSAAGVLARCLVAPVEGDLVAFGTTRLRVTGVERISANLYLVRFAAGTDIAAAVPAAATAATVVRFGLMAFQPTSFVPRRFTISVGDPTGPETYANLALTEAHPQYYVRDGVINKLSARISVGERIAGAAVTEATMPATVVRTRSGADGTAGTADFRRGFEALEVETESAMLACPDALMLEDELLQADVIGAMIGHAEAFRRYAIVDAPRFQGPDHDARLVTWRNRTVDSTYAGVFAPHVQIVNLDPAAVDRFRIVPPSGFVAGVFARTDRERGVHKAPGNERVRGIVGLTESYSQRRQDRLNPAGVNLIRTFPGRGTRLWGARNATDDVTWRYVNVRRLFNFIETSVERSTQWVVFEPNVASTWLRVRVSVENFLDQQWRAGALAGAAAAQAYRVRVGLGETMTETDIDLGLVIIEVAVAPAKPAEFVIFRFSHKRQSD